LQADVFILKSGAKDIKVKLESLTSLLQNDINSMKSELDKCTKILTENVKENHQDSKCMSDGLAALVTWVNKIDKIRILLQSQVDSLNQKTRDNSRNIEDIFDTAVQNKNNEKLKLQELNECIETELRKQFDQHNAQNTCQAQIKDIDAKLKQVVKKTNGSENINAFKAAFESFSNSLYERFDSLNSNIERYVGKLVNANRVTEELPTVREDFKDTSRKMASHSNTLTKTHTSQRSTQDRCAVRQSTVIDLTDSKSEQAKLRSTGSDGRCEVNLPFRSNHRFKGVIRKRSKSYLITGIDLDSDQEGLEMFLEELGVTFKTAKFLNTRRVDCQSAQIVVSEDQFALIENPRTWPEGISCRPWLKYSDYRNRSNNVD
jgi:hypothetical protein